MQIIFLSGINKIMKLFLYLCEKRVTYKKFADEIGIRAVSTVYRYANGTRTPSKKIMQRIYEVTNGAVTANDFMDFENLSQDK